MELRLGLGSALELEFESDAVRVDDELELGLELQFGDERGGLELGLGFELGLELWLRALNILNISACLEETGGDMISAAARCSLESSDDSSLRFTELGLS